MAKVNLNKRVFYPVQRMADTDGVKAGADEVSRVLACLRRKWQAQISEGKALEVVEEFAAMLGTDLEGLRNNLLAEFLKGVSKCDG